MRDKTNIADAITAVNEIVAAQATALTQIKSALEQKAKENNAKAQALDVILGEDDDETILLGGEVNG